MQLEVDHQAVRRLFDDWNQGKPVGRPKREWLASYLSGHERLCDMPTARLRAKLLRDGRISPAVTADDVSVAVCHANRLAEMFLT